MSKTDILQAQLQSAIHHNHGIKLYNTDYPGYWLLVVEEELDHAERRGILSSLNISERKATMHKAKFCQKVAIALAQEE